MALVGNISEFNLVQVLKLIDMTRRSGRLVLERENERVEFFFKEGRLSQAKQTENCPALVDTLVQQGRLEQAFVAEVNSAFGPLSDVGLAVLATDLGLTERAEIERVAGEQYLESVERVLLWHDGRFRFEPSEPFDDKILVRIGLERVVSEGSKRLSEWNALAKQFPSLDISIKLANPEVFPGEGFTFSEKEWLVIVNSDGRKSLREIAEATGLNEFDIRRVASRLTIAGLAEITTGSSMESFVEEQ